MTACSRARLLAASFALTALAAACCGDDEFFGISGSPPPPPPPGPGASAVVYLADADTDGVNELYHLRVVGGVLDTTSASTSASPPASNGGAAGGPVIPGSITKLHPDLPAGGGAGPIAMDHLGGRVVFRLWEQDQAQAELWTVDLSTDPPGAPQRLDEDGSAIPGGVKKFALTPDGKRVLYRRAGGGQSALFLVDLESPALAPIPVDAFTGSTGGGAGAAAAQVSSFAFSPDGAQVAFLLDDGNLVDLYVRPVADMLVAPGASGQGSSGGGLGGPGGPGSNGKALQTSGVPLPDGDVLDFVFSPDSTRIAWRQQTQGEPVLWAADVTPAGLGQPEYASGGDAAGLAVFPKYDFSVDGSRLAFMADDPDGAPQDNPQALFLTEQDGAGWTPAERVSATAAPGGTVLRFLHAPDGGGIAYVADQEIAGRVELWWIALDGSGPSAPVKLNAPLPQGGDVDVATDGGDVYERILFTPDGSGIVYTADQEVDEVRELYLVRLDGPAPSAPLRLNGPLPADGDVAGPYHLSGDGALLVYRADQDVDEELELFLVDLTDPDPASTVVQLSADMVPGGDAQDQVHFAPDRMSLIYRADQEVDEVYEIFYVDLESEPLHVPLKVNGPLGPGGDVGNFFQTAP